MTRHSRQLIILLTVALNSLLTFAVSSRADGPADNSAENVRPIPKPGIDVPEADRPELEEGLGSLAALIKDLEERAAVMPGIRRYLPDVMIFHRAVDQALHHQEFFDAKELPVAKSLLKIGQERAKQLQDQNPKWSRQTGLVVKGYISKIDHTVQPYGLIIPDNYDFDLEQDPRSLAGRHRLDFWFHGRGETLSEVNFIQQRLNDRGQFTPPDTIVLHPYGRYCNANKFAGEIDTFEALEHAKSFYRINDDRIAVRGFSMGGAACWQFAVHYPGMWFAANPGAGFSETPDFLKVFQNETLTPTWYEQKLWRMYDCTGYAANLAFLPTVAYSGDMDKQKQAADIMEAALKAEHLPLLHIIGPMTAHKIHPDSKIEIEKTLSMWDRLGPPYALKSPLPVDGEWETIEQFVTYTLRYNKSRYITILGMKEHWEPARIVVQKSTVPGRNELRIKTAGVTDFGMDLQQADIHVRAMLISIDDQLTRLPATGKMAFHKIGDRWHADSTQQLKPHDDGRLRKIPGLQGPIDDAFMDSFVFVKPTSTGLSPEVDAWVQAEFDHAVAHWRKQMRGDARIKLDTEITKADMQAANIVLWGDPRSNETLRLLNEHLPIGWNLGDNKLTVGEATYDAATHVPLMIFPNPLAPQRYVVLNSSFTYREYDYLNNARQTPKLPDWAIVDVRTPPSSRFPGKVVAADFFDEAWKLKPAKPE